MKRSFLLLATCFSLFISLTSFFLLPGDHLVEDIFNQTNKFRKSRGKPALIMREELNSIAQDHSVDMASGHVAFGHSGFNQRERLANKKLGRVTAFAENVAYGVTSAKEVVTMWKNSPGHRHNMLGNYKYIGIGIAKDRKGQIYYTQVFAN